MPVIFHEIETNGIGYADILFDMSDVQEEDASVCWYFTVSAWRDRYEEYMDMENFLMRLTCILVVLQHHWNYTMMLQR